MKMNNLEKLSTLLAFVVLIVAVTSTVWKDFRLENQEWESYASDNPVCTAPGPMCHKCKNLYSCDDKLRPSKVWTCNSTQFCSTGKCTNTPSFECSPPGLKEFPCQMEGLYPDPGNCFKYHICVAQSDSNNRDIKLHAPRTCKDQYSYNVRTGYCDKKMNNSTCQGYAVPLCTEPLQTGALKDNPSIYYTCRQYEDPITDPSVSTDSGFYKEEEAILYPFLEICDNGKQYNPIKYSCN